MNETRVCGVKCGWEGDYSEMTLEPHPTFEGAKVRACPKCGCDTYKVKNDLHETRVH